MALRNMVDAKYSGFDEDSISISRELHRQGMAALSGAAAALLQARLSISELETELHRGARLARERQCDASGIDQALTALEELSRDILARRAAVQEFARDFRSCDQSLTPVRSRSSDSMIAYQQGVNFADRKVKR